MWKTFQHDGKPYMIKLQEDEVIEVYFTDLTTLWIQSISKDSVLKLFQEYNPLFEVKVDEAVAQVIEMVACVADINVELSEVSETLELTLRSQKAEFRICFKFNLEKASSDIFLKKITVPLIQTVKHLEEQQEMLYNVIQKKDRELEEYKLEKGEISRGDLVTEKFDDSAFDKPDQRLMINIFGSSKSFWDAFVDKHGHVIVNIDKVKKDPWNHIKRKRQVYSSKTIIKKGKGINYNKDI